MVLALNMLDLVMTVLLLERHLIEEANPLFSWIWRHFGTYNLAMCKVILVALGMWALAYVSEQDLGLARLALRLILATYAVLALIFLWLHLEAITVWIASHLH